MTHGLRAPFRSAPKAGRRDSLNAPICTVRSLLRVSTDLSAHRSDGLRSVGCRGRSRAESSRRRRIGWGLLQAFLAAAHGLGASKMFLFTAAKNAPARTLYEEAGGTPHERGATVTYWSALT